MLQNLSTLLSLRGEIQNVAPVPSLPFPFPSHTLLFFFPFFLFFPTSILQYVLRAYGVPEFNLVTKSMESDMKEKTQDALGVCYKASYREETCSQRKP